MIRVIWEITDYLVKGDFISSDKKKVLCKSEFIQAFKS